MTSMIALIGPEVLGPASALLTAALWAVSPMLMASAGRRVGSFPVVLLRSLLATALLVGVVVAMVLAGVVVVRPSAEQIGWLAFSGFMGMGIGDVLIYEAFVTLGPRRTTQVLVLAPPVAVICGWAGLGEAMTGQSLAGIAITLGATFYAIVVGQRRREQAVSESTAGGLASSVLDSKNAEAPVVSAGESGDVELVSDVASAPVPMSQQPIVRKEPGNVTMLGILCAVGGAICMGIGAVTGRQAFKAGPAIDPVCATLVRVASAAILLWAAPLVRGQLFRTLAVLKDRQIFVRVGTGTILGPFIGMFCYMAALKQSPAGVVSTLVATSPLFAIPITWLVYRARIGWDVCAAALAAAVGVGLLYWQR